MIATFGTDTTFVQLKQVIEPVAAAIAGVFDPNEVLNFEESAPSHDLWHLPIPYIPPLPPVWPNRLHWPADASRFATFFALVTDDDLAILSPVCWGDNGPIANTLSFTPDSPTETESITAVMFALPPRPLTQIAGAVGLWLLPLVDQRYFWWMVSANMSLTTTITPRAITNATNTTPIVVTSLNHGLTTGNIIIISGVGGNTSANGYFAVTVIDANTVSLNGSAGVAAYTSGGNFTGAVIGSGWSELFSIIGAAIGSPASQGFFALDPVSISASYGNPGSRMVAHYQPMPLYFDAAARTIGRRVVAQYDGTITIQSWDNANNSNTTDISLISTTTTRPGRSGGFFSDTIVEQVIPANLTVAFLQKEASGQFNSAPYIVVKSLASLALAEYGTTVGYPGSKTIFANTEASYPGTTTLTLGTQSSGTFTLTFTNNSGTTDTTSSLSYTAAASDIQSALQLLTNIGTFNVTVSGTGPFTITFVSSLQGSSNALQANFSALGTPANASIVTVPSNLSALSDYATQAATDWYLWQLQDNDLQFQGVVDWTPNGVVDLIEIWVTGDRCSTRISRSPYNELTWGCLQDLGFYPQVQTGITVEDSQTPPNIASGVNTVQFADNTTNLAFLVEQTGDEATVTLSTANLYNFSGTAVSGSPVFTLTSGSTNHIVPGMAFAAINPNGSQNQGGIVVSVSPTAVTGSNNATSSGPVTCYAGQPGILKGNSTSGGEQVVGGTNTFQCLGLLNNNAVPSLMPNVGNGSLSTAFGGYALVGNVGTSPDSFIEWQLFLGPGGQAPIVEFHSTSSSGSLWGKRYYFATDTTSFQNSHSYLNVYGTTKDRGVLITPTSFSLVDSTTGNLVAILLNNELVITKGGSFGTSGIQFSGIAGASPRCGGITIFDLSSTATIAGVDADNKSFFTNGAFAIYRPGGGVQGTSIDIGQSVQYLSLPTTNGEVVYLFFENGLYIGMCLNTFGTFTSGSAVFSIPLPSFMRNLVSGLPGSNLYAASSTPLPLPTAGITPPAPIANAGAAVVMGSQVNINMVQFGSPVNATGNGTFPVAITFLPSDPAVALGSLLSPKYPVLPPPAAAIDAGGATAVLNGTPGGVVFNNGGITANTAAGTSGQLLGWSSNPAPKTITGAFTLSGSFVATSASLDLLTSPAASLSLNSQKITNLLDPTSAQDAATKNYVDIGLHGLSWKNACQCATTAALPANTYLSGVITITATGTLTVDGHLVAINDRVLVKNEATGANNGIYLTTTAGAVGVQAVLTRATDNNTAAEIWGCATYIEEGTTNVGTTWANTNTSLPTLGTTALTFAQISGPGTYTAGTGLTLSGNQFAIDSTVVTLTGSQTLTNKILTSPTINNPTLTTPVLGVPTSGDFSSGTFTWPTFNQNTTGTATNATNAANIGTTATTSSSSFHLCLVTTSSGNQAVSVSTTGLTYQPSTDTLSATNFNGTATLATLAVSATNLGGGVTGSLPYQSAAGTTAFLAPNTAISDKVPVSRGNGSAGLAYTLSNAPALSGANFTAQTIPIASIATIGNNTILGNVSGSSASPAALTPTQVWSAIATAMPNQTNLLINGSGRITQNLAASYTTSDQYTFDQWRLCMGSNGVQVNASPTPGTPALGFPYNNMSFTKITGTGKILVFQPLNSTDCLNLANVSVVAQIYALAGGTNVQQTCYLGILNWTSGADALPATTVTAFNASGTNPSFTSGWALVSSPTNISPQAGGSIASNALKFTASTSTWQNWAMSVTLPGTVGNLALVVWTDVASVSDEFSFTAAALTEGSQLINYQEPLISDDLKRAYYYQYVSPNPRIFGNALSTGAISGPVSFPVVMRAAPTVTGATVANSGSNGTFAATNVTTDSFRVTNSAVNWTVGAIITGNYTAKAQL